MAEFLPRNLSKEDLPPQYTSASRGEHYEGNKGAAIAGVGLTKAFETFVQTDDLLIKENIKQDAEGLGEQLNKEFGVNSATAMEGDLQFASDGTGAQPRELQTAAKHLGSLQAAFAKQAIPERYYWERANSLTRQLKAKYPGYSPEIDTLVSSTLGGKPANRIREELFQEAKANATSADKEAQERRMFIKQLSTSTEIGGLPKDFLQREQSGQPYSMTELEKYASDRSTQSKEIDDRRTSMQMTAEEGKLTKQEAGESFRLDAATHVQRMLQDSTTAFGQTYKQLQSTLSRAATTPNKVWSADEIGQLTQQFNVLEAQTRTALDGVSKQPWSLRGKQQNSYVKYLEKKEIDDAISTAMAPITIMKDAISQKDFGIIGAGTAWLEANKNSESRRLLKDIPWAGSVNAMKSIWGDQNTNFFLNLIPADQQSAMAKTLTDYGHMRFLTTGNGSAAADFDEAKKNGMKDDYFKGQVAKWQKLASVIGQPDTPPEIVAKMTDYYFGKENLGILGKMDAKSARNYYQMMVGPQTTQQMMKLRDMGYNDAWNTYQAWVAHNFIGLSDGDFKELGKFNLDRRQTQIVFNGQTNRFQFVDNPAYDPTSNRERLLRGEGLFGGEGGPVTRGIGMLMDRNDAQGALDRLNQTLQPIIPIIGANKGTVSIQLQKLLKSRGIDTGLGKEIRGAIDNEVGKLSQGEAGVPDEPDIVGSISPFQPRFQDARLETSGSPGRPTLANVIGKGEGDYNSFNRGSVGNGGRMDFSEMTVGDVLARQSLPSGNSHRLFAVGKYQVIPATMKGAVKALGIGLDEKLTPELQDKIFSEYLVNEKRPQVQAFLEGKGSIDEAQKALAMEFASVADPSTGRSYYDGVGGNRSSIGTEAIRKALRSERLAYQRGNLTISAFKNMADDDKTALLKDMVDYPDE